MSFMLAFKDQGKWLIDDLSLWRSFVYFHIYVDIITLTTERQGCVRNFLLRFAENNRYFFLEFIKSVFAVLVYVYFV